MYSIDRVVVLGMLWWSLLRTAGIKAELTLDCGCEYAAAVGPVAYTGGLAKSTEGDVSWIVQPGRNRPSPNPG